MSGVPSLAPELAGRLRAGALIFRDFAVGPSPPELETMMSATETALRERWAATPPGAIPALAPARRLYRTFGQDPTRTRPASEALLRRILRGKALPRINSAVDLCNLAAVSFFLPIGLYDLERLRPPVIIRLGREGEAYEGIGKPEVHLAGRPCVADADGPCGNPSADSRRTAVTDRTRHLLWIVFAPADYDADELRRHLDWSAALAEKLALSREVEPPVLLG